MKKLALAVALMPLLLGFTTAKAEAGTITYQLDCSFVSPGGCKPLGFSYGTITISDDLAGLAANQVRVTADIVGTFSLKKLFLNYSFDTNSGNTLTSSDGIMDVGQNNMQANGLSQGKFDIGNKQGNINANSYTTILTASGATLDSSDFDLLNVNNLLYAAVHIGSTNCSNDQLANGTCVPSSTATGNQSLWLGASSKDSTVVVTAAPEPATFALFGAAAAAMAVRRRRRQR